VAQPALPTAALSRRGMLATLDKYKERYLLLLPALLLFVVFRYVPMAGIVLAWKQFNVTLGLFGSPWAGWKYFERLLDAPDFYRALRNTLFINGVLRMGVAFFMPIIFALLLNEIAHLRFKRVVQTISYLPPLPVVGGGGQHDPAADRQQRPAQPAGGGARRRGAGAVPAASGLVPGHRPGLRHLEGDRLGLDHLRGSPARSTSPPRGTTTCRT